MSSQIGGLKRPRGNAAPTVSDILSDPLSELATKYWALAPGSEGNPSGEYNENIVKNIYYQEIEPNNHARIQILDFSGYLENYLWFYFQPNVCSEHIFSAIYLINGKISAGLPVFDTLTTNEAKFKQFFEQIVECSFTENAITDVQRPVYVKFLINVYQSLENVVVRKSGLRYLFLSLWENLSEPRLQMEFSSFPQLKKHWLILQSAKPKLLQNEGTSQSSQGIPTAAPPVETKMKRGKKAVAVPAPVPSTSVTESNTTSTQPPNRESTWIFHMIKKFLNTLEDTLDPESFTAETLRYLEVFAQFVVDLLSQLPTRRFLNTMLDDMNFVTKCKRMRLCQTKRGALFLRMIFAIDEYMKFPLQDHSGKSLNPNDVLKIYHTRIHKLQQIAFADYAEELNDLIFCSIGELCKVEVLQKYLLQLTSDQLIDVARKLGRISQREIESIQLKENQTPSNDENGKNDGSFSFVLDILISYLIPQDSHIDAINLLPLYPTEKTLWDCDLIPKSNDFTRNSTEVLALPKLNLQFLTMQDYLRRNFELYRLESSYEIRENLVDAIKRLCPEDGVRGTVFHGWSRMAIPLISISIDKVTKPKLGETVPHSVECSITVDLSKFSGIVKEEWESLREHDVIFLVCIEKPQSNDSSTLYDEERAAMAKGQKPKKTRDFQWQEESLDFPVRYGIKYVRGGEIFELRDEDDNIINDFRTDSRRPRGGSKRRLRIKLDSAQYYTDLKEGIDCYSQMNIIMRRKSKENNFKSVLETTRDLMNTEALGQAVPSWLHDVLLGYGNPAAAHFRSITSKNNEGSSEHWEDHNYIDTFLDASHVVESFPNVKEIIFHCLGTDISVDPKSSGKWLDSLSVHDRNSLPRPPYKLKICRPSKSMDDKDDVIRVATIETNLNNDERCTSPYPEDESPRNSVRFTSAQVNAIRSGINVGLTMVIGPPGTGKTDTAVQIICNLYHNFPNQKILIVTHSNAALNDLFEKIMDRDVDPRHLVRLGSGEKELRKSLSGGKFKGEEFTKQGRINWSLSRRLQLLSKVQRLGESVSGGAAMGDVGYTCETAAYFYSDQIKRRIEKFELDLKATSEVNVKMLFPFNDYFSDTPEPLFSGTDTDKDLASARGCFRHITKIFSELEDYRAFELLRTQAHRADYLVTKQARIVAMTCTHAAISRRNLIKLGFRYDSVVMEESAQVLEVESLIPMLLQNTDSIEGCRLKRVIMIGDHYQLPPVVQHMAIQKYSNFDQSLFARFFRLGVPSILLDKQGRSRPELADLFRWRYHQHRSSLGNLDCTHLNPLFRKSNPGFAHTFQLVDVPAFNGKGESAPTPFFYQNLGEAEYVVAVYQYMRLLGYPAEKISIITTYNGQKHLIRDILSHRCKNSIFGSPATVSTVDKFQGQQNDYVLLSLVRTEAVGHIRDVRRLVVALSRARLGLYVFCRQQLFENCFELSTSFNILLSRPTTLQLVSGEEYVADTFTDDTTPSGTDPVIKSISDVTTMGILVYQMADKKLNQRSNSTLTDVIVQKSPNLSEVPVTEEIEQDNFQEKRSKF